MTKKLLFTLFALVSFSRGFSQTVKWDSTFRPNIYTARADQFPAFKHRTSDIVFLGNSIITYANWDELFDNRHIRNRGIPGDITFGVLARLGEVIEGKPAKVFIMIGINDIARGIPDSVILENYRKIIQRIKKGSPATKIYFQTLMPVNNTFKPALAHFNKDEHILNVNAGLRKLTAAEKITLIDVYPLFLDAENKFDKNYCFDGLHPNGKGYLKWAEMLKSGNYLKK